MPSSVEIAGVIEALARAAQEVEAAARDAASHVDALAGARAPAGGEDAEWSPSEIMGHVCDGARVWGGRMRRILYEDEPALEAFDEGLAMRVAGYHWKRLEPMLAEFRIVSDDTLAFLRGLSASDWARAGRHPALGRVTMRDLARIEQEHEQGHAQQLRVALTRRRPE